MKAKIQVLPTGDNVIYAEREEGLTHTPFALDRILYTAIREGDVTALKEAISTYLSHDLIIGHMSSDKMREVHYWAVATISVAIHYAILGGLDETDAYNLSDVYIRRIDKTSSFEECIAYLHDKAIELTAAVARAKETHNCSPKIRLCLHYIHVHLHDRLSVPEIAAALGVSRDYLSARFAREMGLGLHRYILNAKIREAAKLLLQNKTNHEIAYTLSFCSESHFITCFKQVYGLTPQQYRQQNPSLPPA